MGTGAPLTITEETKVIALLARGDSYSQIRRTFEAENGRTLNSHTIMDVRKRNAVTLQAIKDKTLAKQEADAEAIKTKANSIIKKQLDSADMAVEILAKAGEQYLNDEIGFKEYGEIIKHIKHASLPELVTVSKEMHAQSAGPPLGGSNPEDLAAIRTALESGDEVSLTKLMFKKNGGDGGQPVDNPQ